jgi:hypothetical protein
MKIRLDSDTGSLSVVQEQYWDLPPTDPELGSVTKEEAMVFFSLVPPLVPPLFPPLFPPADGPGKSDQGFIPSSSPRPSLVPLSLPYPSLVPLSSSCPSLVPPSSLSSLPHPSLLIPYSSLPSSFLPILTPLPRMLSKKLWKMQSRSECTRTCPCPFF